MDIIDTIQCVVAADMALLVFKGAKGFPTSSEKVKGTIDVWWIVHILFITIVFN
jgi:hypothetical protein